MVNRDLKDMRFDYESGELDEKNVSPEPFTQFDTWFKEFLKQDRPDANAMVLSTCGENNRPGARIVLLKEFDNSGFVFFTNYSSRKGRDLLKNPYASLLFYWSDHHRQVRIDGKIEKISAQESEEYFHSRPRDSQIAAFVSHQSAPLESRDELLKKFNNASAQYEGKEIPMPENWGGYRLLPDEFEFWQGRENRLHDRITYKLENGNWVITRLNP